MVPDIKKFKRAWHCRKINVNGRHASTVHMFLSKETGHRGEL